MKYGANFRTSSSIWMVMLGRFQALNCVRIRIVFNSVLACTAGIYHNEEAEAGYICSIVVLFNKRRLLRMRTM